MNSIDSYLEDLYSLGIRGLFLIQQLHAQNVVENSYLYVEDWLKRKGKIQESKYISGYICTIQRKLMA